MKNFYLLNQFTFYPILSSVDLGDVIVYDDKVPNYIVLFFTNIFFSNVVHINSLSKEEKSKLITLLNTTNNSQLMVFPPEELISNNLIINSIKKNQQERFGITFKLDIFSGSEFVKDSDVLHYIGTNKSHSEFGYRRFIVNEELKKRYKVDTIYGLDSESVDKICNKKYKMIFISAGNRASLFFAQKAFKDKTFLVYDRSDNWSSLDAETNLQEDYVMRTADFIFYSADSLKKGIPQNKINSSYYIPNGFTYNEYNSLKKFDNKTIVYAGNDLSKANMLLINTLAENNKDWTFYIYGRTYSHCENNITYCGISEYKELFKILCKSHLGLIAFNGDSWTRGMLPLKLFNYANAHIPTLYYGCSSLKDYSDISVEFNYNNLDLDYYLTCKKYSYDRVMKECTWELRMKKMFEVLDNNYVVYSTPQIDSK